MVTLCHAFHMACSCSFFTVFLLNSKLVHAEIKKKKKAARSQPKRNPLSSVIAEVKQAKQLLLLAQKLREGVCPWREVYVGEVYIYDLGEKRQGKTKTSPGTVKVWSLLSDLTIPALLYLFFFFLFSGKFYILTILPSLQGQWELLLWAVRSQYFSW